MHLPKLGIEQCQREVRLSRIRTEFREEVVEPGDDCRGQPPHRARLVEHKRDMESVALRPIVMGLLRISHRSSFRKSSCASVTHRSAGSYVKPLSPTSPGLQTPWRARTSASSRILAFC